MTFIKTIFKFLFPVIVIFIGVYIQFHSLDPKSIAIARSGCLIVLYGIILESFYVIRLSREGAEIVGALTIRNKNEKIPKRNLSDYINLISTHCGLLWVCIGTLLWGFGDLI